MTLLHAPASPPSSAEAAGIQRLSFVGRALRQLAIGVTVCAAVAVFLRLTLNEPFGRLLVFSLCIGLTCQFLIEVGRRLAARWLQRHGPNHPALRGGWPGWHWTLPIVVVGSVAGVQIGYPMAGWLLGLRVRNLGLDEPRLSLVVLDKMAS